MISSQKILTGLILIGVVLLAFPLFAEVSSFDLGATDDDLVDVYAVFSVTSAPPGSSFAAAVVADVAPGWHINSAYPNQDYLIPAEVSFGTLAGFEPKQLQYPAAFDVSLLGESMSVYDGQTVISFQVAIDDSVEPGEYHLPVTFTYQPCNDRECRSPATKELTVPITVGEEGQPQRTAIFSQLGDQDEGPGESSGASVFEDGTLQENGLWGYFVILGAAFVTGLLLSFSPCTYPMIPITVSIFAGQTRSMGRGFFLSLIYVTSMALVYGLMGLVVSLVGGVFGAWLASPPVVIGIAVVFVVFALSMFGLYDLNLPLALRQKLGTAKSGGGVIGVIILGIVAALVVSPCVGPFVAGVLLYIATQGSPLVGFLTLFVFAMGLGTLFIIIGTFSSAISGLPRSGEWMETVKKFFGFVLLVMALYFLQPLLPASLTAILGALLLLSFGVFGGGLDRLAPESGFFPRLKKLLGFLALIIGTYLLIGSMLMHGWLLPPAAEWLPGGGVAQKIETGLTGWETDLNTGLERAKAEGKPILIDTWATWCANCRVLERKTFGHPSVIAEAARFVLIKVQLEKSDSRVTNEFKARFGLKTYSLPTTLLLTSQGEVARIMTGVVEPEEMVKQMRQLR